MHVCAVGSPPGQQVYVHVCAHECASLPTLSPPPTLCLSILVPLSLCGSDSHPSLPVGDHLCVVCWSPFVCLSECQLCPSPSPASPVLCLCGVGGCSGLCWAGQGCRAVVLPPQADTLWFAS